MTRVLAAGAFVSLLLAGTRVLSVPIAIATLGIATVALYWLANALAGRQAARATAALFVASEIPLLVEFSSSEALSLSAMSLLSLPWWLPLVGCAWLVRPDLRTRLGGVAAWWATVAAAAVAGSATTGSVASFMETAPAALMAGIAVAGLAELANEARRRHWLAGALAATAVWQIWLVLGTGRPARFLVPMIVAAFLVAATDLLTDDEPASHEAIGAAVLIAMLVLGVMPGAHALVEHRQTLAKIPAAAGAPHGADAPSSIEAP